MLGFLIPKIYHTVIGSRQVLPNFFINNKQQPHINKGSLFATNRNIVRLFKYFLHVTPNLYAMFFAKCP